MQRILPVLVSAAAILLTGCPPENYPNVVGTTISEVDRVRNDEDLTPQQKRDSLAQQGFAPTTINALLSTERLANQFGGDLRTAYVKVTGGQLLDMTPDEVQIYGDEASGVTDTDQLDVVIEDAEAQAIVTLFQQNRIRTPEDLSDFLANPDSVIPSDIPPDVLRPLFIEFDPDLLLPELP
ncbi:MAG: hypothetical protein AB1716_07125 [Planctomycetota bacterium]